MKVPYSWLKEFVNINISAEELGDKLVSAGFEIEEIIYMRDTIKKVVVGKIVDMKKHINSDHLKVCQLNFGENDNIQIVTGASNVSVGDVVPVALDGALLPNGKTIAAGELRGEKSYGMLCSGGELGLLEEDFKGAGVNGIWLLDKKIPLNTDINDVINNNEIVLDVAITANRPDCNSIIGIAREVAAVMELPMKMPKLTYKENNEIIDDYVKIENKNYDLCPRYMAKAIKNVKECVSPRIIRDRLKAVGIRAINNLVDVTNYVLIEIGQPMHAFDLSLLGGKKIVIRNAEEGEKIVALDEKEYSLKKAHLVICDEKKPIAIAGIMGGAGSSICLDTNTVVLESARFARDSIRHTSREINLHSDSSARYEKGIDFYSQETGMNRALALFDEYGWGEIVGGIIDLHKEEISDRVIKFDYNKINKIIGKPIAKDKIIEILNDLTLKTTADGDILTTIVPNYREDIVGVNDLTEEIIRIYGYDFVEPRMISNKRGGKSEKQLRMDKIRNALVAKGAFEVCTYSFITPKAYDMLNIAADDKLRKSIELRNPLSIDFSVMRTTLSWSMLKTIGNNINRGNKCGRFFELANIYEPKALPLTELPYEHTMLSVGLFGDDENYYKLKAIVDDLMEIFGIELHYQRADLSYLHNGRSAYIIDKNDNKIGYLGEIHPDVNDNFNIDGRIYLAELDAEYIVNNGLDIKPYKAISKYQAMERDLALIAPIDKPAADILNLIKNACSEILEDVYVFDVYVGGQVPRGKKSIAVKLIFRDYNRTLKDNDVNSEIDNVLSVLKTSDVILR